jgi:hypothetical protein
MNRTDFVRRIFKFCGKDDGDLMREYDLALSVNKPIDWDKLYSICIKEMKNRYLPAPSYFLEQLDRCLIADKIGGKYDGIRFRSYRKDGKLPEGYPYEYETYNNNLPIMEWKHRFVKKYGDKQLSFRVFNEETIQWDII